MEPTKTKYKVTFDIHVGGHVVKTLIEEYPTEELMFFILEIYRGFGAYFNLLFEGIEGLEPTPYLLQSNANYTFEVLKAMRDELEVRYKVGDTKVRIVLVRLISEGLRRYIDCKPSKAVLSRSDKALQEIKERKQLLQDYDSVIDKMTLLKNRLISPFLPVDMTHISVGSWDCGVSPFGLCAYNDAVDTAHDFCVFCGKPDERK